MLMVASRPCLSMRADISPNLLRKIIEDIRLTPEQFVKLL
jgi:hypothetical protein